MEKIVQKWKIENDEMIFKKEHFATVLKMTLDSFTHDSKIIQNGFRASGLMPFHPQAVDYNVLQKKKNRSSIENEQFLSNMDTIKEKNELLNNLETNLSEQLLEEFIISEASEFWTGDVENKGLFQYWLKIKKAAGTHSF